jgi:hypothetical protein
VHLHIMSFFGEAIPNNFHQVFGRYLRFALHGSFVPHTKSGR